MKDFGDEMARKSIPPAEEGSFRHSGKTQDDFIMSEPRRHFLSDKFKEG